MKRFTTSAAAFCLATALVLPTSASAQPEPAHRPTGDAVSVARVPVGASLAKLKEVQDALLRGGYRAVLLLGIEPLDSKICSIFANIYHDSFGQPTDKVIYFTKQQDYIEPSLKCDHLNTVYDPQIMFELNEGDLLAGIPAAPTLMIVCRDSRNELLNKGYVVFSSQDSDNAIQRRFAVFDSYYRKGPPGWADGKHVDGSMDMLDTITNFVLFRSPKNTPCH